MEVACSVIPSLSKKALKRWGCGGFRCLDVMAMLSASRFLVWMGAR